MQHARGDAKATATWLGGGAVGNAGMWSFEEDECLQTDSCGSCGQVFLWCKCDVVTSRTQRTARASASQSQAAAETSPVAGDTPVSSVWSSEEEKGADSNPGSPREFGAGLRPEEVVSWTRTTLCPNPVRNRAPSVEGRELTTMS